MDFIFELLAEIIMEPIIEGWVIAMTHFSDNSKKIDEEKIKYVVVIECIVLMLMFIIGGIMLLKSGGESLGGKVAFISSIVISVVQILLGVILNRIKKKRDSPMEK